MKPGGGAGGIQVKNRAEDVFQAEEKAVAETPKKGRCDLVKGGASEAGKGSNAFWVGAVVFIHSKYNGRLNWEVKD